MEINIKIALTLALMMGGDEAPPAPKAECQCANSCKCPGSKSGVCNCGEQRKWTDCGDSCVCGCNEGQACRCGETSEGNIHSISSPRNPVRRTYQQPTYYAPQYQYRPTYYTPRPTYQYRPMYYSQPYSYSPRSSAPACST